MVPTSSVLTLNFFVGINDTKRVWQHPKHSQYHFLKYLSEKLLKQFQMFISFETSQTNKLF